VLPPLESFSRRHIGPSPQDVQEMLKVCGVEVSEQTTLTILELSTACYQSLTTENNILLLDYVNIGEFNIPTIK